MHDTHRQSGPQPDGSAPVAVRPHPPVSAPTDRPATRERAFRLVADGVAAGLPLPSRISMLPGYRQLSLDVGDRAGWDSWRTHLDCADVSVRVYEARGGVRRCSVARAARAGYRIAVELTEDVDTRALRESVCRGQAAP